MRTFFSTALQTSLTYSKTHKKKLKKTHLNPNREIYDEIILNAEKFEHDAVLLGKKHRCSNADTCWGSDDINNRAIFYCNDTISYVIIARGRIPKIYYSLYYRAVFFFFSKFFRDIFNYYLHGSTLINSSPAEIDKRPETTRRTLARRKVRGDGR